MLHWAAFDTRLTPMTSLQPEGIADAALQGAVAFLTQCLRRKNLRNPRNLRLTRRGNALEIRIRKGYFLRLLNVFWKSGNSCFPFSLSPK